MGQQTRKVAPLSLRRLRDNRWVRELVQEHRISHQQMIQPLFVVEGISARENIPGLTGVYRDTPKSLLLQIEADMKNGVHKFLLFGVPQSKSLTQFDHSFTSNQIRAIKKAFGKDLFLSVDVCLCSSTSHGQCGIISQEGDHVENSATVDELARAALSYAQAGADCVAPSDMMDGRVGAIRNALHEAGLDRTLILSYSAKFHSKYYGPFRVAADSAPKGDVALKDRATYQIDPARPGDALISSLRDAEEGADMLMVKPGLPYLDILSKLKSAIPTKPWIVYEVSGEYASIEFLAEKGLVNGPAAHIEAWTAFARAGASSIITYGARNAKKWLSGESD
ncbi:porphobilinogen synthase [bacterium]|jgi:porphobilinogen synthase|nr:porphobilinogen synthase [bacterium]